MLQKFDDLKFLFKNKKHCVDVNKIIVLFLYFICSTCFFIDNAVVIMLLLASLNSCCNPWIYLVFSGNLISNLIPCDCSDKPKTSIDRLLCPCSQNRKLNSPRHKRKWTFRSADSYVDSRSTNVSGIRNEHIQAGSVIQNNGAILADVQEDDGVLNGKNDIKLNTYGTMR